MTYKLFTDIDERFNLNPRSFANVQSVCRVMCESNHLHADDVGYYAQIGGFEPQEENGQKFYSFAQKWTKSTYLQGMVDVLFIDTPKLFIVDSKGLPKLRDKIAVSGESYKGEELIAQLDVEEVYKAFCFFLSCIGETVHDHAAFMNISKLHQLLNLQQSKQPVEDGENPS
jgi:hypothetical protein